MSGSAAHPDVTSTETMTTAKSRQTSPPWAVYSCPRNNCAPPAAQGESDGKGSESAKPEQPAVQLLR
ncbi:hypothetical protein TYRP_000168 [Tyrophagus putrescentiae]|nr:hypothetical protein TYRP_000168 [Tyrophagus putrescentiae]